MALRQASGKTGFNQRHARGFRSAAVTVRKRLSEAAARHGFAEPEVLVRWPEIVGEQFAALCAPVKVSYSRSQGLAATLVVRAEGARAPEIEHLGPRIVERVNQFYGYRAIGRLKVTQAGGTSAASHGFAEEPADFTGQPRPAEPTEPDAAATARAAELAAGIENDALRAALTRMGAHVFARGSAPEEP